MAQGGLKANCVFKEYCDAKNRKWRSKNCMHFNAEEEFYIDDDDYFPKSPGVGRGVPTPFELTQYNYHGDFNH